MVDKSLRCGHVELKWNGTVYESAPFRNELWKLVVAPGDEGVWSWIACYDGDMVRSSSGFEDEWCAVDAMYLADGLMQWFVVNAVK